MADLKQIAETLVNLTVKEVNELATILKDEYGIEPAAAAAVMVAGGGGGEAAAAEEKTAFDVILNDPTNSIDFTMEPGDVFFADNNTVLHNRNAFTDATEVENRRCLVRLWLAAGSAKYMWSR